MSTFSGRLLAGGAVITGSALASAIPGVSTEMAVVSTGLGVGLAANFLHQVCDAFGSKLQRPATFDPSFLENHDLKRLVGQALEATLARIADSEGVSPDEAMALRAMAQIAQHHWREQSIETRSGVTLDGKVVTRLFAMNSEAFARVSLLDTDAWDGFLLGLEEACDHPTVRDRVLRIFHSDLTFTGRKKLSGQSRRRIAERLRTEVPSAIYETAKHAFTSGDPAYASIQLRLMGELMTDVRDLLATIDGGETRAEHSRQMLEEIAARTAALAETMASELPESVAAALADDFRRIDARFADIRSSVDALGCRLEIALEDARSDLARRIETGPLVGSLKTLERLVGQLFERSALDQIGMPAKRAGATASCGNIERSAPGLNPTSVGRDEMMQAALSALGTDDARAVCLTGEAGTGKTELARAICEAARSPGSDFDAIWWADVDPAFSPDWLPLLAREAGIDDLTETDPVGAARALRDHLNDGRRHLIVLDNAEDQSVVDLLPSSTNRRVLLTSRTREWPSQTVRMFDVAALTPEQAQTLLAKFRDDASVDDLSLIGELVGRHPLALVACGAWLARPSRPPTQKLIDLLQKPVLDESHPLLSESLLRTATRCQQGVLRALGIAWESLTEDDEIALVRLCGIVSPEVVPVDLLARAARMPIDRAIEIIDRLHAAGVGRVVPSNGWGGDTSGILVHRLVQESVRLRLRECPMEEIAALISGLEDAFWDLLPEADNRPDTSPHQAITGRHARAFLDFVGGDSPASIEEFAKATRRIDLLLVHAVTGMSLIANGAIPSALATVDRAERLLRPEDGEHDSHVFLLDTVRGLGALFEGRTEAASQCLMRSADFMLHNLDKVPGTFEESEARARLVKGVALTACSKFAEATGHFDRAIDCLEHLDDCSDELNGALFYRATLNAACGRLDDAEADLRAIDKTGMEPAVLATMCYPLSIIHRRKGQHAEALRVCQEMLAALDPEDESHRPARLQALALVAVSLLAVGRVDDAQRVVSEADTLRSTTESHPLTDALLANATTGIHVAFSNTADGLASADRAIRSLTELDRLEDPILQDLRFLRGMLLIQAQRFEEAVEEFQRAVDWYDKNLPQLNEAGIIRTQLARALRDLGRNQEALQPAAEAIQTLSSLGPPSAALATAHLVRATVLLALTHTHDASADATKALDILDTIGVPQLADRATAHRVIGNVQLLHGDFNASRQSCDTAIALLHEAGPPSMETILVHQIRGIARQQLGDAAGSVADLTVAIDLANSSPNFPPVFEYQLRDLRAGSAARLIAGSPERAAEFIADIDRLLELADVIALNNDAVATLHKARANVLVQIGDHAGAVASYSMAIDRFDDHGENYVACFLNRAASRRLSGDNEGAIADANDATAWFSRQNGPTHLHTLLSIKQRAFARLAIGDLEGALEDTTDLLKALRSDHPDNTLEIAVALECMSQINERLARADDAIRELKNSIELVDGTPFGQSPVVIAWRERLARLVGDEPPPVP